MMQTLVRALRGSAAANRGMAGNTWRSSASSLEEVSFLPILHVMKGLPVVHETSPQASAFRAVRHAS